MFGISSKKKNAMNYNFSAHISNIKKIIIKNDRIKILGLLFVFGICFLMPLQAQAASYFISPSDGTHSVGKIFSIKVYVSSTDQAMNAASGVLSFSKDQLEVVSLSKADSILSIWTVEPSFSNSDGRVNFEGIALNPGYTGSFGKIITVNFKVKAPGSSLISFASGSVLANDGLGTNLLTAMGNAQFNLGGAALSVPESTTPSIVTGTPSAPQISSRTHPDTSKWYSNKSAKFVWSVPQDITDVRESVGKSSKTIPTNLFNPPISQREIKDIADGVWYMNVQFRNKVGWGEISHYRFQIDTEKPDSFDITEITNDDSTDPRASFIFKSADKLSGIDHYVIQIDNGTEEIWKDTGDHNYHTPPQAPGNHTLIAKAIDKAGNERAAVAEFKTDGINAPVITDYPRELESGQALLIRGSTYPDSDVILNLERDKQESFKATVKSDYQGIFTYISDNKLADGTYQISSIVQDKRGAQSLPSEKINILISKPAFIRIGNYVVTVLSMISLIALLIFALIVVVLRGWYAVARMRKRISKDAHEAETALKKSFKLLRDDIKEHVMMLEKADNKRDLTKEEQQIMKELKRDLDDAEKFMQKEIEVIEREVDKK